MREWTREERYRKITDATEEELVQIKNKVELCPYRQRFHIQPNIGLLNDPNGFSYFNGEYHLFYQWFPLGPVHGLKHWYHVSSKDLINWKDCGVAIIPEEYFESHGAFSGSGFVKDDELYMFYTGNTRDENWVRHPYQCLAIMNKNGKITKYNKPIIDSVPEGYTDHFRDPKIIKENDKYYCLIGAQKSKELLGSIVYYESDDLLNWNFVGDIKTNFKGNGFMWECPDYITFDEKGVIILSPQGLECEGDKYLNIYQSGYLLGNKINFENGKFNHGEFKELDRGFDFYAPQTTEDNKGRKILIGWVGLPEIEYPTDKNYWAHCLTIPREITLKDDKLIQKPAEELKNLRGEEKKISFNLENEEKLFEGFNEKSYEMICEFKEFSGLYFGVKLKASKNEETLVYYDIKNKKIVLDRSNSGEKFAEKYGTKRKCYIDSKNIKLQIFVDVSSIEIFINDGEEVFTSRIFTKENSNNILFFSEGYTRVEASAFKILK